MTRKQGQAKVLSQSKKNKVLKYQYIEKHEKQNKAILMFSFGLGLRVSEISFLSIEDVLNLDGSFKEVITLKKENTKGNKTRQIPFGHKKVIQTFD